MEPENSSGDIYHIISYIILCVANDCVVPEILLTYDTGEFSGTPKIVGIKTDTAIQVSRGLQFADFLGYRRYFSTPLKIDTVSQHMRNRCSVLICKLMEYTKTKKEKATQQPCTYYYINQKCLTTFIAYHFFTRGLEWSREILRRGYEHRSRAYLESVGSAVVDQYVEKELSRMARENPEEKALIILHVRCSRKANSQQNLNDKDFLSLETFLKEKGYAVWFIFADGRLQRSFSGITERRSDPFTYGQISCGGKDHAKICHLDLLLGLLKLKNLVGMIGNTSGVLDLAAFIGHRVYNYHKLQKEIDYQAARIIIQSSFLTIEFWKVQLQLGSLQLKNWLQQVKIFQPPIPEIYYKYKQSGYLELFFFQKLDSREDPIPTDITNEILQFIVIGKLPALENASLPASSLTPQVSGLAGASISQTSLSDVTASSEQVAQKTEPTAVEQEMPPGEQLGWNCFDVAIGLDRKGGRAALVAYAVEHAKEEGFRRLLVPEIKQAAALTAVYMNGKEEKERQLNQLIGEIFALEDPREKQQVACAAELDMGKDDGNLQELARNALPASMHTERLRTLVNEYTGAHEQRREAVAKCNDAIGRCETLEGLKQFFGVIENRVNHETAYDKFVQALREVESREQALQDYCMQQEIYEEYVREYYGKNQWFAFQPHIEGEVTATSMIDIAARMLNVTIVIYQGEGDMEKEIYCTTNQGVTRLEVTYNGHNHFWKRKEAKSPTAGLTHSCSSQRQDPRDSLAALVAVQRQTLSETTAPAVPANQSFSSEAR